MARQLRRRPEHSDGARYSLRHTGRSSAVPFWPEPILGKSIFFASRHLYVTRNHRVRHAELELYTETKAVCAQL
jgi:hypothetical protein